MFRFVLFKFTTLYGYLALLVFAALPVLNLAMVVFGLRAKTGYLSSIIHGAVLRVSCSFIAV